jgi:biotin carboxylase
MMPYLSSPEVSVDALYTPRGCIFIPRRKMSGRQEIINPEDEVIPLCKTLLEHITLRRPCNLQFRYYGGMPCLLEINTRMSGGIGLSYIGTGINIPNIAVNQLLGIEKPWDSTYETASVSYVESPLLLEEGTIKK